MRNNYRFKNFFIALLALSSLTLAYGGNIPQYSVSKNGTPYAEFSDGTAIPCQWNTGTVVIYPGNVETPNAYSAQGFPIGFDFRFGGRIFNQFVVSSSGNLYLGKDMVNYGDDAFRLGMSPMMYGVYRADISYKISGEEGDRVLTVQFKRAILDEVGNNKGKYSLQLRLHEADGTVEMAFKELETLYNSGNGFDTGLFGWDGADALQLYAAGLDSPVSISSKLEANMLESDSYIHWDCNDYDMDYAPVFVFSPVPESPAPVNAPDLEVSQSGTTLNINCVRADGADATVVLVSETPFTEADLPVDGETFRGSYRKPNGNQVFPSMLGNAKPLYYGNDQSVSLAFDNAVEGKTYYVKALSANGYPAYNRDNTADVEFITSQAAPRSLTAVASSQNEISISVMSDDPVIVAMSTEAMPGYQKGYAGVFGTPSPDAKTGDDIPGGGKVVYAGDPADFDVTTVPNELTYFRAWTVRNGHLSSTSTDAIGIAMPSYPYAPAIENYPFGEQLRIWEATENQFIPWLRSYAEDRALYAVTLDNQEVVLQTPELPLDCPVKVSFEFALETQRAAASGDGTGEVELPQGNEPGLFGDTGYLKILAGGEVWRIVNSYAGTMVSNGEGGYISGSSTFEAISVDIPAIGDGERITFSFSVPTASMLYLRNIIIETTGESPTAPATIPTALWADENRDGIVTFGCTRAEDAAATLVLYSNQPLTDAELPEDGRIYSIGSKIGSATVLYYGQEEEITCATPISLVPEFDADCYFRAVSASSSPLYNIASTANLTYHTLPDMGYPENLSAILTEDGETIEVKADKAPGAEGTLLLVSVSKFEGVLEDGMAYAEGDAVGNATVLYRGTDSAISVNVAPMEYGNQTIITGYSYNPRIWYSSICRSATVTTTSIEEVVSVPTDLSTVEIYNIFGQRLSAKSLSQLPAGVYIINGSKMVLR